MAYEVPVTSTSRAPSTSSAGSAHALAEGGSNGRAEGGGGAGGGDGGREQQGGGGRGNLPSDLSGDTPGVLQTGLRQRIFSLPAALICSGGIQN